MPDERELSNALSQLRTFEDAAKQQQASLTGILQNYHTLIEDHKRLQSDYEEERDARERYKQMARGSERASFVLFLADGDGYIFDDSLLSNGTEGGQSAGQLLNRAIQKSLASRGIDSTCNVMVRFYANLSGLSKAASKAGICGPEKRALAPFAASFTRSNDLFDFVDAGDLKENADFKIRAMFRQFVNNPSCKHIFFAGCHDVGYVAELTPFRDNHEKITLVRTPAFHHQFNNLGLRVEDFPGVFRTAPLDTQQRFATSKQTAAAPQPSPAKAENYENTNTKQVCNFFQRGQCKFGNGCKFAHTKDGNRIRSNNASMDYDQSSNAIDWRSNADPSRMTNTSQRDNAFFRNPTTSTFDDDTSQSIADFFNKLPQRSQIPHNKIPINKTGYRLDTFIPNPSAADKSSFHDRVHRKKLCNTYHIVGTCRNGSCEYDHDPVSEGEFNRLLQMVYNNPCKQRGNCRSLTCYSGHVCQNPMCKHRGGKGNCKFGPGAHMVDLQVGEYVDGERFAGDAGEFDSMSNKFDSVSVAGMDESDVNNNGKDNESDVDDEDIGNSGASLPMSPGPQSPLGEGNAGVGGTSTLGLKKSSWTSGWAMTTECIL